MTLTVMYPRTVFLTHSNRTGSTYLSKLLSEYAAIGMSLEMKFPDGIILPMPAVDSEAALDRYLDIVYNQWQFGNWGIDKAVFRQQLLKTGFPLSFRNILEVALDLFFEGADHEVRVYKNGLYIEHMQEVEQAFPEARFLYIHRDPRAMYSSRKRSQTSDTRQPMATDPIGTVEQYKLRHNIIRQGRDHRLLVVRYEDLLLRQEETMARVLDFLGIRDRRREGSAYAEAIPESQKHLHGNIVKKPITARIDAWKKEISPADLKFIQRHLEGEMRKNRYPLEKTELSVANEIAYLKLEAKYQLLRVKWGLRKALTR